MQFKTLYGPVRSGRLGLSLGVDLLGKRICSLDCIYCEVGPTRVHTLERRPYMPARTILDELQAWKDTRMPEPEVITLGGLGEPCLNTELETIINGSRAIYPDIPVAVLTNSTLLHEPEVRRELGAAQVVLPSLDTLVPDEFLRVNAPCKGVSLERITSGLLAFRTAFSGLLFLEILLIQGTNDSQENLERLRDFLPRLAPDRVDVVTMTRPGASPLAKAVDRQTLDAWRAALVRSSKGSTKTAPKTLPRELPGVLSGKISDDFSDRASTQANSAATTSWEKHPDTQEMHAETQRELVLNSLRRRPQTIEQVCAALRLDPVQMRAVFAELTAEGAIHRARELGEDFFQASP
ncbi:MAG: radical SAM protein [Desulfovibrionales bacterium]|nr:MAG: radical SAM protein [Desulfovibrionales bacterium]